MTIDPAMMKALGVLALGRPGVFPPGQPGKAELWASLLTAAGYTPGEVSTACSKLLLARTGAEWVELGDVTSAIDLRRRELGEASRSMRVAALDAARARQVRARAAELEAQGWSAYNARLRAAGEIPDSIAAELDQARGLRSGAPAAVGPLALREAGRLPDLGRGRGSGR